MRSIDNSKLVVKKEWESTAMSAAAEAEKDTSQINAYSHVWRDMKDPLGQLSHGKCWYCEVRQIRSDNAVDHYRPKDHYWWLAFSVKNFRYACTYCNSRRRNPETGKTGGKGNHFPLEDENKRAKKAGDEALEAPMLLDPCQILDPGHLAFDENGQPKSRYPDAKRMGRTIKSIELYHLDHPELMDKRRILGTELATKIKNADIAFSEYCKGNGAVDTLLNDTVNYLKNAMHEEAELSTFARCIISGHREKEWVDALIQTL